MKINKTNKFTFILAAGFALAGSATAGVYKHITIDGSFADWAGISPSFTRTEPATANPVAYKDIYVANDEDYLYIRFTLFAAADPFTSHENIFVDADASGATGFAAAGGRVGSEMLIQGGAGYQEKDGGFNEGAINGLGWASGPAAPASDFEVRISRKATYASDGTSVFAGDFIAFLLEAEDASWTPVEFAPPDIGGLFYVFEAAPSALTTNLDLLELAGSSWQMNGAGTDLGVAWLDPTYDDTQPGWNAGQGLFGFTPTPTAYPAIQTPLVGGANTYYFRGHFQWNYSTSNLVFVVTNYLSDGAAYYLNGAEVQRVRMPGGVVGYGTSAIGTNSPAGRYEVFGISTGPVVIGDNVLQVETHQAAGSAQDMVFGLSLTGAAQFPVTLIDPAQPADRSIIAGNATTFRAEILGSGPLSYQWLKDGVAIPEGTNTDYTLAVVLPGDAGAYSLQVSNPISTNTTRAAVLVVTGTPVVLDDISQPADQSVVEGSPVTFTVVASGSAPVRYQWHKDADPIADATNASFTIPLVRLGDAGSYQAHVSNLISSTNSRSAQLAVQLDKAPPVLTDVQGSPNQITVDFSEPVDPVTASVPSNYGLDGSVSVLSASLAAGNPNRVLLTTTPQTLGTVHILTVNRVEDLFGNPVAANSRRAFLSTVIIDGSFTDWASITPIYSAASNDPTATNWRDIYAHNDANFLYLRITTWDPTVLQIWYNNFFFDTDDNPTSGYAAWGGSEMLIQSGAGYQEKNGGFNEGGINDLDWLCLPAETGTNFEFRISRAATYASDGLPVFTTNVINFVFDAENSSYQTVNRAPVTGVLSYSLVEPPPVPPGPPAIGYEGNEVRITWTGAATLQSCGSLVNPSWTNVPSASSPYRVQASGGQRYFRLMR